jgi:SAM-dependent methyltransferase
MIDSQGIKKGMHECIRRFHNLPGFALLGSTALLEYSREYLNGKVIDHHHGEWDDIYSKCGKTKPGYDLWLDKYESILKRMKDTAIIDLGCGYGNDTLYLRERGYTVISCDLSREALRRLQYFIDKPMTIQLDMLDGLPFDTVSAKVIIADLSIHYFRWEDTERIVKEIERVLTHDGYLLCRVHSLNDIGFIPKKRNVIQENYYNMNGREKRFFTREHFHRLFRAWNMVHIAEYPINRFGSRKVIWEVAAQKKEEHDIRRTCDGRQR